MSMLHPEIWSHVCSFLYHPTPVSDGKPGGSWRDLHQHDLTVVMRVNSTLHDAAAGQLYKSVHVANLPSFFCGVNHLPANRASKQQLLGLVKSMTLYNPRVTSSRRQASPNVFTIDPVYPFPDRRTLKLVDETLDCFAGLSIALESMEGLLPQLRDFTSTSLNTDKWEPIEQYILSTKDQRYADMIQTGKIINHLIRLSTSEEEKHWRFWPVSGPYSKAIESLRELRPGNSSSTQFLSQYPTCLPSIDKNRIVMLRPIIAEQSFGRYLNWPELRSKLVKATHDAQGPMELEIGCRLVPNHRRLKDWGKIDQEVGWEMDKVEEINALLEIDENASWKVNTKLVWMANAVVAEQEERRGR